MFKKIIKYSQIGIQFNEALAFNENRAQYHERK